MALDGIKHPSTTACTDGDTSLCSGSEVATFGWRFDKQKSKTTKSRYRKVHNITKNSSLCGPLRFIALPDFLFASKCLLCLHNRRERPQRHEGKDWGDRQK